MKKIIKTEKLPIKLWADEIDIGALKQAKNLANLPFAYKWISIMPDVHEGYGMPIGGVLAAEGYIVPNAVGVDIGCGMSAVRTSLKSIDRETLIKKLEEIRKAIPVGFTHHKNPQHWEGFDRAPDIPIIQRELDSARRQLGTLGGGNHFIEIQKGSDGHIWLMVHSGSRNFGYKTAGEYYRKARKNIEGKGIQIPDKELSYLDFNTKIGQEYFMAMNYCLDFARANRELMLEKIMEIFSDIATFDKKINIHHNYASIEKHFGKDVIVHRKGATQAKLGQTGIIPGSMGTSSYITEGLGNPDSFESCSHGSGRLISRREADRILTLEECQKAMKGIEYKFKKGQYDEAPQCYKNIEDVMKNQSDLARPLVKLKPLGIIKG